MNCQKKYLKKDNLVLQLNNNNNQAIVLKFWHHIQTLNRLVRFKNMYYFSLFYYIQSHTLDYSLNWHVLFTTSINVIFGLLLHFFFCSLKLIQLTLSHWCINSSPLNMTKPSQMTLPHLFSLIGTTLIFKRTSSSQILSFFIFTLFNLNILIFTTPQHFMNMFLLNNSTFSTIKHRWRFSTSLFLWIID